MMEKRKRGYCIIMEADNTKISPNSIPSEPQLAPHQIIDSPPRTFIALADRKKTKSQWWTRRATLFMVFENESAAREQCKKLHYGHPVVVRYEKAVHRTGHWFWHVRESGLGRMITEHEQTWHDDNWNEGTNAKD